MANAMTASDASLPILWRPSLETAHDTTGTLAKAADAAALLVAEMGARRTPHWLTFAGTRGSGKTMLAGQIMEQAQALNPGAASLWIGPARRPRCVWYNETEFAQAVQEWPRLPEYLAGDYLVVIDDLGTARDRWDQVADALYRLANARLGKWMVWTTNLTHAEIEAKIDARLASRLIRDGNTAVRITAQDYALRNRKQAA